MSAPDTVRRLLRLLPATPPPPPAAAREAHEPRVAVRLDDEDGAGWAALDRLRADVDRIADPTRYNPEGRLSARDARLVQGGRESMALALGEHRLNILTRGVGSYYGSASMMTLGWIEDPSAFLQDLVGVNAELPKVVESDCIKFALQHVKAAYEAAGKGARFARIQARVERHNWRATTLALELQKDGWEAVYFNPDVKNTRVMPEDEGGSVHVDSVKVVLEKKAPYYGLKVKHAVLDYRAKQDRNTEGLEALRQVPFFFGLGRAGSHAFVGYDGRVQELHWDRMPTDPKVIDDTPFERFPWESGILMVPPRSWPESDP